MFRRTFEAQIWQWPINRLNTTNTNMYTFMFGQHIPGPGKRRVREAVAQKDAELAETDIAVRARDVMDRVKRACAELFVARKAIEVHHASVGLLRQLADVAQAKEPRCRIRRHEAHRRTDHRRHGDVNDPCADHHAGHLLHHEAARAAPGALKSSGMTILIG